MFCPECGAALKDEAKFCANCGAQIEAPAEAEPQPEAQVVENTPAENKPEISIPAKENAKSDKKPKNKKLKWIILSAVAFLLVVVGVFAVILFTSPAHKFSKEMKDGNYSEALNIYKDDIKDSDFQKTLAKMFLKNKSDDIAEDIVIKVLNGELDLGKAKRVFAAMDDIGLDNISGSENGVDLSDFEKNDDEEKDKDKNEADVVPVTIPETSTAPVPDEPVEILSDGNWADEAYIATLGEAIKAEANGKTIKLKLWGPEAAQDVYKKQVADFVNIFKDYANIQIDVKVQDEADTAFAVLNDPESAADVFGIPSDQLDKLCVAEAIAPAVFADDVMNNSEPSVKSATKDGVVYAYPYTCSSYILAYDKSVISEEDVKSFESLLAACENSGKTFIMDAKNSYFNCVFLFSGGCQIDGFEADGETQKFTNYDIDKVTKTVKAYADVLNGAGSTFIASNSGTAVDGFKKGTCAAGIVGSWDIKNVEEALGKNVGYAVIPTITVDGEAVQSVNMFGYKLFGVNKVSKYPLTAQVLASYMTNYDCDLYRAQELGWTPVNLKAQKHEDVTSAASINVFVEQSKHSVVQSEVATTFWDPLSALGTYLFTDGNDLSEKAIKAQVEQCIESILDI